MTRASTGTGATWAMMGYDTKNQYWNPNETTISVDNAGSLDVKWSFNVAGYPPGTPIIAEGKVFVLATGGMYAIDLDDGSQAWAQHWTSRARLRWRMRTASSTCTPTRARSCTSSKASDGTIEWGPVVTYSDSAVRRHVVADRRGRQGVRRSRHERRDHAADAGDVTDARGGVVAGDIETGEEAWHYYTVRSCRENGAMVWSTVSVDRRRRRRVRRRPATTTRVAGDELRLDPRDRPRERQAASG